MNLTDRHKEKNVPNSDRDSPSGIQDLEWSIFQSRANLTFAAVEVVGAGAAAGAGAEFLWLKLVNMLGEKKVMENYLRRTKTTTTTTTTMMMMIRTVSKWVQARV
jgi:hypothetical protein